MHTIDLNDDDRRMRDAAAIGPGVEARPDACHRSDMGSEPPTPSVTLGHSSVDRDHQHLLSLIARFADLAIAKASADALAEAVCDLTEFTRSHFEYEEALMTSAGYPGADVHRMDHAEMMRQLSLYLFRFSTAVDTSPNAIVEALQVWFTGHLQRFDLPMVQFLLARRPAHGSSSAAERHSTADAPTE